MRYIKNKLYGIVEYIVEYPNGNYFYYKFDMDYFNEIGKKKATKIVEQEKVRRMPEFMEQTK